MCGIKKSTEFFKESYIKKNTFKNKWWWHAVIFKKHQTIKIDTNKLTAMKRWVDIINIKIPHKYHMTKCNCNLKIEEAKPKEIINN